MRNMPGELGRFVVAFLNVLQRRPTEPGVLRALFIKGRDLRIQVPAIVIELARDGSNLLHSLLLNMLEADDDVSHLNAGIVNVVLHLNLAAAAAQQSREGVA